MWKEAREEERVFFTDREKKLQDKYEAKMKAWNNRKRAGGESEGVVTEPEQVPEAKMTSDETLLFDLADNYHHKEEAVQQKNDASEGSAAEIDHLIDASYSYTNNVIKHPTVNWDPSLEAEAKVGTSTDEVTTPSAQQKYAPQQQQRALTRFHDPTDNMESTPAYMDVEPNTLFYRKCHTVTSPLRLHRI
jgi:hypothetical protein